MPAAKCRAGRTTSGRQLWEALRELVDRDDHVISPGELFTLAAAGTGGQIPICSACRPFEREGGSA